MTDTESTDTTDTAPQLPDVPIPATLQPAASFADLVDADHTILAPRMLDSSEKEALADAHHEFTLLAIAMGNDDSGAYWSHLVDLGGTLATFRLQCHGSRDRTAQQLAAALESRGPIGGMVLKSMSEKLGNKFLVLWPAGRA